MFSKFYKKYKNEFVQVLDSLDENIIEQIMKEVDEARVNDRNIFIVGNGGSASSASHWSCDLGKGVNVKGVKRLKVFSPAENVAVITALGNDISYNDIFLEQIKNHFNSGDLIIALSVSGSSENLVKTLKILQKEGGRTISLIGARNGKIKDYSDICFVIPSDNYGIVEDVHMFVNHVISQYLKKCYQAISGGGEVKDE